MKRRGLRSRGVEQVATAPVPKAGAEAGPAFEVLYRDCRDDVFAYVVGLLRDVHAAEDATALAFERAYRKRRRFDPDRGSGRAWIFGIARNAALDELRKRKRIVGLFAEPAEAETTADDGDDADERAAALRHAMSDLAGRDRELIALRFFADLSHAEIAAVLGISASNAATRLHRAIDKLRRACDENA
jgi:RNA polymerase sigma-70 factor, ECF subfamily